MFLPVITRSSVVLRMPAILSRATFVTSARRLAAGDTGSPPKTGGQGDAFQRRERASEDLAIRRREREKLLELKKRIAEQRDHLDKLSDHIDDITRDSDGENAENESEEDRASKQK